MKYNQLGNFTYLEAFQLYV